MRQALFLNPFNDIIKEDLWPLVHTAIPQLPLWSAASAAGICVLNVSAKAIFADCATIYSNNGRGVTMQHLSILASDMDHDRQRRWRNLVAQSLRNRAEGLLQLGHQIVTIGPITSPAYVHANRMLELADREEHGG